MRSFDMNKLNDDKAIVKPLKGRHSPSLGPVAVMVGSQSDLDLLREAMGIENKACRQLYTSQLFIGKNRDTVLSVTGPFIGAPYAAMILETLIAWGAKKILLFGCTV